MANARIRRQAARKVPSMKFRTGSLESQSSIGSSADMDGRTGDSGQRGGQGGFRGTAQA